MKGHLNKKKLPMPTVPKMSDKYKTNIIGKIHDESLILSGMSYIYLIIEQFPELNRNREFYRTHDVRPPFTYVDMIRQVFQKCNQGEKMI